MRLACLDLKLASLTSALGILLASCGASIGEYQRFSAAGKEYYDAVGALADASRNIIIESNSEMLLRDDIQEESNEASGYRQVSEEEAQYIQLLTGLKRHS